MAVDALMTESLNRSSRRFSARSGTCTDVLRAIGLIKARADGPGRIVLDVLVGSLFSGAVVRVYEEQPLLVNSASRARTPDRVAAVVRHAGSVFDTLPGLEEDPAGDGDGMPLPKPPPSGSRRSRTPRWRARTDSAEARLPCGLGHRLSCQIDDRFRRARPPAPAYLKRYGTPGNSNSTR